MDESAEIQRLLRRLERGTLHEQIEARTGLGHIFAAREQWDYAAECFEANMEAAGRSPDMLRHLAAIRTGQGRSDEGAALLHEVRQLIGSQPTRVGGDDDEASGPDAADVGSKRAPIPDPRLVVRVGLCLFALGVALIGFDGLRYILTPLLPFPLASLFASVLIIAMIWGAWVQSLRTWVR